MLSSYRQTVKGCFGIKIFFYSFFSLVFSTIKNINKTKHILGLVVVRRILLMLIDNLIRHHTYHVVLSGTLYLPS
jgi:tetrahydromethanopterin S-methyltransferase subunit E